MEPGCFAFADFVLDPGNRQLTRAGAPVELNARYLDALALLVGEHGRLVSKARFLEAVWRGVPVTDEALTQCIRTLRRQLGDSATAPRFIETVPKHGYRFIAAVEPGGAAPTAPGTAPDRGRRVLLLGAAGTIGGGGAGGFGGLLYGMAAASSSQPGVGAVSMLLVLVGLCLLVGAAGGAGVGFGIAATELVHERGWPASVAGGAGGGLAVGALAKLLGLDAFDLLLGRSPGDITGAAEGALLGAAVGLAAWLAHSVPPRRGVAVAGLLGGAAGIGIALLGGRLMGGSLDLLARRFPGSRLRLDPIGALLGEPGFGPVSRIVTAGLEGLLFAAFIVAALLLARRLADGDG